MTFLRIILYFYIYKKDACVKHPFYVTRIYGFVGMLSDMPNIVFLVMSRSFALTSSNGATSHAKSANGQGHWLQVLAMIGGIVIQSPGS